MSLKREIAFHLGDLQYKNLSEKSVWEGELSKINLFGHFRFTEGSLLGLFKWTEASDLKLESYRLPSHLMKGLIYSSGLSLIVGPKRSGRSCLLQSLALHARQFKERNTLMVCDESPAHETLRAIRFQHALSSIEGLEPDLIFLDQKETLPWKLVRRWIDLGTHVIMVVNHTDIRTACEWIRSQDQEARGQSRLDFVKYLFAPRLFLDKKGVTAPLLEVISNHRSIRDYISEGDWEKVYGHFKQASNAEQGRTLNQAITQALVDQKIDFQQAFEMSSDPEELDLILKRMGI
jgi:Tfp pilus assembly pilus retraction ATPase PilT